MERKGVIDVFFYGGLAQHISMNQIEMPFEKSATIADVKIKLAMAFETWHTYDKPFQQAINRMLVDDDAIVNIGDEVSFFPPILEVDRR